MILFNIPVKYNEFIFSVNESQRCISATNCVKHWREIYPVDMVIHMMIWRCSNSIFKTECIVLQALLEAPDDIFCFKFNPSDPNIIAGGCINGQVTLQFHVCRAVSILLVSLQKDIHNVACGTKVLQVLIFAIFPAVRKNKFPQIKITANIFPARIYS